MVKFLNHCRLKSSEVRLCLRCNSVLDKEATKERERRNSCQAKKFVQLDKSKELFSNKGKGPVKFQGRTYVPTTDAPPREWLHPTRKWTIGGENGK